MEVQFEINMRKEMPTVSTEDLTFDPNGVLDGLPPGLVPALEYGEENNG